MNEHVELEPCPYCGGHASLSKVGRDWYRIAADHVTGCPLEDFQLDCPQSDDQLPLLLHDWNTRVDRSPSNNAEKFDQLRAEVAGLKTGYEAYERVNAELKAECEVLRSLLGQSALAATTLRTDAEVYANHSGFNRAFVDLIRARSGVEVGHGYGSSKYPQQADVVAALGQGEQS